MNSKIAQNIDINILDFNKILQVIKTNKINLVCVLAIKNLWSKWNRTLFNQT